MAPGNEPHAEPPGFSEVAPVAVGTLVWAVLFVIGLVIRHDLQRHGNGWWIWAAFSGVVLGFVGFLYLSRRRARLAAASAVRSREPGRTRSTPALEDQPVSPAQQPERRPAGP